ncbi:MAG: adenylate/guanylate cyclase domain-containing protein [Lacunisphaera sp.]|nr:adenylate/guanylate cyclase domain-containing protein [Lacunisphaera sp.]
MALIGGAETFLPRTRLGRALARMPFLAAVAVKAAAYLAVVLAVVGGRLGPSVALLTVDAGTAQLMGAQFESNLPRGLLIPVATLFVLLLVTLRQATQLVGERTMRDIVYGRYRRPRLEERFFLFVDIVGSTPVAERLGPVSVHRYLNRVFLLASDPIDQHDGAVVQYVGDEIIVTWKLAEGGGGARPLACLFAIEAAVAAAAADFEREFGTIPRLRAALHAGEVVTGETGGSRRAIVFNGDVMNTTSRIENATRTLGRAYLVSEDALKRMEGTETYALEDMGPQQLRGKEARLRVFAVSLPGR